MSKVFMALLTGMLVTFIVDFFLFLGIKLHYIDANEIEIYFNILFADNQNFAFFFLFSGIFGFIIIFIENKKLTIFTIISLTILAILPLFEPLGKSLGEAMFMKKGISYKDSRFNFYGDVYYDGRKNITFYDYELQKMILLKKKDLR
ncbi:hypothetical protein FJR48_03895 [Sulfurimonas lithotrophica]|uniref:Uncharacterized protein n=1 Tax=Sulfurimonas lithotrophica TaxID=2590022 RepID=A0A5P8NZY4_9BACT|nr:hypothetical protein [Sulfurimonas lithotrophica]QFR48907.1 hypothetical protein FJR48_03895 [Sulfurimonas lithotrophica]